MAPLKTSIKRDLRAHLGPMVLPLEMSIQGHCSVLRLWGRSLVPRTDEGLQCNFTRRKLEASNPAKSRGTATRSNQTPGVHQTWKSSLLTLPHGAYAGHQGKVFKWALGKLFTDRESKRRQISHGFLSSS